MGAAMADGSDLEIEKAFLDVGARRHHLVNKGQVLRWDSYVECFEVVLELRHDSRADDGSGYHGIYQSPGESVLRQIGAYLGGHRDQLFYELKLSPSLFRIR